MILVSFTLRMLHTIVRRFVSHNLTQFDHSVEHEKQKKREEEEDEPKKKHAKCHELYEMLWIWIWCFSFLLISIRHILMWWRHGVNLNVKLDKSVLLTVAITLGSSHIHIYTCRTKSQTNLYLFIYDEPCRVEMQMSICMTTVRTKRGTQKKRKTQIDSKFSSRSISLEIDLPTPTMVHQSTRATLDRTNTVYRTYLRDILMDQFVVFQFGKRLHLLFHHSWLLRSLRDIQFLVVVLRIFGRRG